MAKSPVCPEPQVFAAQFRSSPRGARQARHCAVRRLAEWGHPPACDLSSTVALLVGELAANAVRHGRVPGRDFALRLTLDEPAGLARVEVVDASETPPPRTAGQAPVDDESGRGLVLVDALATRWGSCPREPIGKTVWAELKIN
ncbi:MULTISPECIES: ATP-binding protein [Streptomyces]|uniref:ATP-binding protein n=1 Tax=Streptomyces chilikensis TaxID=1194079 RepID=A0ABV3EU82_9ACTN|nr:MULTISPECIES: ATP-binding protein [Streptomyces]